MAYNTDRLPNRVFMNVPGDKLAWRCMESDTSDNRYHRNSNARYFAIKLSDEEAEELEAEGWPIVWSDVNKYRDDEPELLKGYLKVFIKYTEKFPVNIYLVNAKQNTKTLLEESDLDLLHIDHKKIESIDLMIRPYYWTFNDRTGVKAQVHEMNILLAQDGLEDDYEIVYKD